MQAATAALHDDDASSQADRDDGLEHELEDDHDHGHRPLSSHDQAAELAERLAAMRAELAELERAGRGLADAHARADREIKMRQALEAQRAAAEAEAGRLRDELRAMEAAKLQESLRCAENAEIANQVGDHRL